MNCACARGESPERLPHDPNAQSVDAVRTCGKDAFGFIDKDQSGAWERAEFIAVGSRAGAPSEIVMVAINPGGEGDITASHVRWRWTRGLPYVASPLLHHGRIWLARSGGALTCLDAATGACIPLAQG